MIPVAEALRRLRARPIAHRGLHACGRPGPVENSISAAEAAIAKGYGIECDVQLTADGEAVVFHDEELARLTGLEAIVRERPLCEVAALILKPRALQHPHGEEAQGRLEPRGLRVPESRDRLVVRDGLRPPHHEANEARVVDHIPSLPDFLTAIGGRTPLVVEIKVQAPGDLRLTERTLTLARDYAGPIALESFDPAVVKRCRTLGAPCPVGLVGPADDGTPPADDILDLCDFVSWNINHLGTIATRRPALPRTTWTVRSQAQADAARALAAQIVFEGFVPSAPG